MRHLALILDKLLLLMSPSPQTVVFPASLGFFFSNCHLLWGSSHWHQGTLCLNLNTSLDHGSIKIQIWLQKTPAEHHRISILQGIMKRSAFNKNMCRANPLSYILPCSKWQVPMEQTFNISVCGWSAWTDIKIENVRSFLLCWYNHGCKQFFFVRLASLLLRENKFH